MNSNDNNENTYVFDSTTQTYVDVQRLQKMGKYPLCPICRAKLIVALDEETARSQKVLPGIRCPKDERHISSTIYLATDRDLWKKMDELMNPNGND